jgi:hypothetical protein
MNSGSIFLLLLQGSGASVGGSTASMAATLGADVFAGAGNFTAPGSMAATLGADPFAGVGGFNAPASMGITLAPDTFAGAGAFKATASMAATLGADVFAASGTATGGIVSASMATTLGTDTFAGSGAFTTSGSMAATLASDVFAGAGIGQGGILTFREAIIARLNSIAALTTLVGTRIYWDDPSQLSVYPCLVVQVANRDYGHNLDGADGVSVATVSIEAISQFESISVACIEAVRNSLDGFRGPQSGVGIMSCYLEDEVDATTPPLAGHKEWIYHVVTEWKIKHRVPAPTAVTQTSV